MANDIEPVQASAQHSRKDITMAIGIAFLVALTLLVTIVMPAEYGVDPIGTGRALGLTALPGAAAAATPVAPPKGT